MDSVFGPGFDPLLLHYLLPDFFGLNETNLGLSDSSEVFCVLSFRMKDRFQTKKRPSKSKGK